MIELIKKFVETKSVSGDEGTLANRIKDEIKNYVDEITTDQLGSLIAVKRSGSANAKKLSFSANMDEPGFVATFIEENGHIRVSNLGTLNYSSLAFSTVTFANGVKGVVVPTADIDKEFTAAKLYVDIGAKTKEESSAAIAIGDSIGFDSAMTVLRNDKLTAFGIGVKVGCAVLVEAIKQIANSPCDLYFIFTVQKQLGMRGSKAAFGSVLPEYAFVIDTTSATPPFHGNTPVACGKGPVIRKKDGGAIYSPEAVKVLCSILERTAVPFQVEVLEKAQNDAQSAKAAGGGTLVGCVALPVENQLTNSEVIELNDIINCVELIKLTAIEEL